MVSTKFHRNRPLTTLVTRWRTLKTLNRVFSISQKWDLPGYSTKPLNCWRIQYHNTETLQKPCSGFSVHLEITSESTQIVLHDWIFPYYVANYCYPFCTKTNEVVKLRRFTKVLRTWNLAALLQIVRLLPNNSYKPLQLDSWQTSLYGLTLVPLKVYITVTNADNVPRWTQLCRVGPAPNCPVDELAAFSWLRRFGFAELSYTAL